ncbi:LysR substrate-binding domain-containing protein [Caenimonas aquaedulcis]|uniref:LysR family transcriptional regulator n=1 Tax=Caenimonas aquaedulcis TaxID=2793270 RepID=A0A931H930_9BURK|nr:LysR substrate-binding domain-containing protein [Caenimonas aquaedulcis]MBG9390593.1 LysR family transcriptional regulator [Caenimonas aquaedulcis]
MKRSQLPLTALRAFEVAARHRNLRAACEELSLTPGAVSQQVRVLEERLGVPLFDRTNGRYEPTDVGARLASRLTLSFNDLEGAVREVVDDAEPHRLRLKLAPTFATRWLAPRLESFFSHNRGIDLEIMSIASTSEITFEQCDFLVQFGTPPWPDLDEILLFHDELTVVCSPRVANSLKRPQDLAKQTLLHSSFRPDNWRQWFESAGLALAGANKGPKFPNALLASEAAISGAGVAVMQRAYVLNDLANGRLVEPLQHRARSPNGYYMTSSSRRRRERKIRDFSRWIRSLVEGSVNPA